MGQYVCVFGGVAYRCVVVGEGRIVVYANVDHLIFPNFLK